MLERKEKTASYIDERYHLIDARKRLNVITMKFGTKNHESCSCDYDWINQNDHF